MPRQSRIAHTVLPELRERGVLGSTETTSAAGRMTGLECGVIPMYRAQQAGDGRHVLALSRVELAVLLKLIEVLFAPGWTHKDGRMTPAGMLADRAGRGAATDRLGMLLMVLSTNSKVYVPSDTHDALWSGLLHSDDREATIERIVGVLPELLPDDARIDGVDCLTEVPPAGGTLPRFAYRYRIPVSGVVALYTRAGVVCRRLRESPRGPVP
ncbi:hypothetical protein ACIPSA_49170 [Streptomyces sp. NPDC086549]|uniref:hypothetical protein n=1 Tax=Streptomyces sp. NPDC086549 TaxID=3365752 RepID=UPI003810EBE3